MITQTELKSLLNYNPETGLFTWKKSTSNRVSVGKHAGTKANRGYIRIKILGHLYSAHRLAWLYVYGSEPSGVIDHIDGCCSNNSITNLRDVKQSTNTKNNKISKNNTSGYPGVYLNKRTGKWAVQIWNNKKVICVGTFIKKTDAIKARKEKELELQYRTRTM